MVFAGTVGAGIYVDEGMGVNVGGMDVLVGVEALVSVGVLVGEAVAVGASVLVNVGVLLGGNILLDPFVIVGVGSSGNPAGKLTGVFVGGTGVEDG